MVETFTTSTANGSDIWQFTSNLPSAALSTFQVDMARHAVGFGANPVDTVAAQANFVSPSSCSVYGWNSATTNVPVWNWTLPNCDSSLLYDSYR